MRDRLRSDVEKVMMISRDRVIRADVVDVKIVDRDREVRGVPDPSVLLCIESDSQERKTILSRIGEAEIAPVEVIEEVRISDSR